MEEKRIFKLFLKVFLNVEIAGKKTIGTSDLCSAVKAGMRKSSKCTQGTKETPLERHKSNRKSTEDQSDGHLKQMKIQFILENFFGIFSPYFGKRKLGPILLFGGKKTFENVKQRDMKTTYTIWQVY